MRNSKIGVGIIGASPDKSWAGQTHVPALKAVPAFEVCAVSTSRRESAEAAKKSFGVPLAFDNHSELVSRREVDLVVVSVRVPHHFELVSAALDAGKAVCCEWPLGNGLNEAVRLAAKAREKNVRNWVVLQSRSAPFVNRIRDLVKDGYIGEVLSTSIIGSALFWGTRIDKEHAFIFERKNGVTPLAVSHAHRIDALCYALGEFEFLAATFENRQRTATIIETGEIISKDVEDQIAYSGVLQGGAVASVHYRGAPSRGVNLLWEINGSEGDLQVIDPAGHAQMPDVQLLCGKGSDKDLRPLIIPEEYFLVPVSAVPGRAFNIAQHWTRIAQDFRDGTHSCPTFDDAVVRQRMLDAIERSGTSGKRESYDWRAGTSYSATHGHSEESK